jgi:hypothetical protein
MPTRTWRGTTDSNWGTSTNWLEGAVPTVADDVVFDASSPACTVNASNRVCLTINFTNYTNTITMTFSINVSGNITLGAGMGVGGTGFLAFNNVSATYTPNGYIWPNEFRFISITTSKTYTIAADCTFGGVVTNTGSSGAVIANIFAGGRTITCNAGINNTVTQPFQGVTSLTTFVIAGGTLNGWFGTLTNLNLNSGANTITISAVIFASSTTGTFSYTSGVANAASATLTMSQGILNLGSDVKWNTIIGTSGATTLANDLWCNTLNMSAATTLTGDFKIYLNTYTGSTGNIQCPAGSGTKPTLNFNGGTSGATSGVISIPVTTINAWKLIDIDMPLVTFTSDTFILGSLTDVSFKLTSGTFIPPRILTITNAIGSIDTLGTSWNILNIGSNVPFGTWNIISDIWCNYLRFAATVPVTLNNFNIYVNGSLENSNSSTVAGTTTINLIGSGFWVHAGSSTVFSSPLVINTGGIYRLGGAANPTLPNLYKNGNLNYIKGTVVARRTTLFITATSTGWVNMHRIAFDAVTITGGTTQTMNEFFGGRPGKYCLVRSTTTTNVTITFTDNLEKFARWVLPSNMTVSRRGQVKLLSSKGNRNSANLGFTYFEGMQPYGIPHNNPIVYQGSQCFGIGDSPADPNFF